MAQIIGLPKLSPTMEEGVLVRWVKKEGETVEPGDLVAEVETDKANMDFNLEDEGVLLKLLVAEGDTVKLGAPVAILGDEGEDISALEATARSQMDGGAEAKPEPKPEPKEPAPAATEEREASAAQPSVPFPKPPADTGSHPAARTIGDAAATGRGPGDRILASPLAKSLAIDLGIDLRAVRGTGPGGRIVERDVRAAESDAPVDSEPAADVVEATATSPSLALAVRSRESREVPAVLQPTDEYVDEPLSGIRRTIATRLVEATQTIPHFYLTRDFDAEPLLDFRERLNHLLGERGKVSVNDLLMKGVALALRRVPACNASFQGDAIRYYTRVHLGVAVATERGLITPVVRDADLKGIGVIGAEVRDLATRARDRQLKGHEIQGSTFTVSNLGMFGIRHFEAIINPPEAAILAIGTTREEPVVRDGQITVGKIMSLTLSCDHRVIDGALGAKYLSELVDILEKPESLAL